eukprot:TRINITY_DN13424_c0_g1_i1.p1 TRINITY_DN13424_c0_g1~~TRINITY_DN13424_c0_g1_i1.p1  ORF type:complete len:225 (+),score=4.75 TRINITY_DN13424_c0_g1_i1:270-944(+)
MRKGGWLTGCMVSGRGAIHGLLSVLLGIVARCFPFFSSLLPFWLVPQFLTLNIFLFGFLFVLFFLFSGGFKGKGGRALPSPELLLECWTENEGCPRSSLFFVAGAKGIDDRVDAMYKSLGGTNVTRGSLSVCQRAELDSGILKLRIVLSIVCLRRFAVPHTAILRSVSKWGACRESDSLTFFQNAVRFWGGKLVVVGVTLSLSLLSHSISVSHSHIPRGILNGA